MPEVEQKTEPAPGFDPDPDDSLEEAESTFMNLPELRRRRTHVEWVLDNTIPLAIIWGIVVLALAVYVLIGVF